MAHVGRRLAIAGLPPLNGFVSEWLLLQAFLSSYEVPKPFLNMLLPLGAALIALAAALAGYVMVKFFGVIFLGQPREPALERAHDAGWFERIGLVWLAAGCVALGLFPTHVIGLLEFVPMQFGLIDAPTLGSSWWRVVPVMGRQASYAPLVFLSSWRCDRIDRLGRASLLSSPRAPLRPLGLRLRTSRRSNARHRRRVRPADPSHLPAVFRNAPRPADTVRSRAALPSDGGDRIWTHVYLPLATLVQRVALAVAWLQQGRISTYLMYSFVTLLVLLGFVL